MPRKRKTDSTPTTDNNQFSGPSFPDIGNDPIQQDPPSDPVATAPPTVSAADFERLQTQIAEMDRRNQELTMALLQNRQPAPQQAPQALATPEFSVNVEGLPDPNEVGMAAYMAAYNQRVVDAVGTYTTALQTTTTAAETLQREREARLSNLWARFNSEYEDYAEVPEIVESAARRVATGYQSRGLDLETVLVSNPDQFLKDVAGATKDIIEKVAPDEDEPLRTGGIPSAGIKGAGTKTTPAAAPGLLDQLKEAQKKSGYF